VMLNLLKFRDKAVYKDGRATDLSGLEAYMLYGKLMSAYVLARGGKLQFSAPAAAPVIGADRYERLVTAIHTLERAPSLNPLIEAIR